MIAFVLLLAAQEPVRVYVLAGQSNMEGKAKVALAERQAARPELAELYAPWRRDGRWLERDDVRIRFLGRGGPLTVGYGSPGCIGPELEFGRVVGDRHAAPVLLVKAAWGGRSLYRDFRPPSAGLPPEPVLEKMLADRRKKAPAATMEEVRASFGASYRAMLEEIRAAMGEAGPGARLSGLVWFQGWNDMISAEATAEYAANLAHFIRDVRKDLGVPRLPVVVGQMGVDGEKANPKVVAFKEAQAAGAARPEFAGGVALVKTDAFWDVEAETVFKKGWKENLEAWNQVGSDFPYHYLGSVRTMMGIGRAFGEALLRLE